MITKLFILLGEFNIMPKGGDNVLRTIADELLELVKRKKKISVEGAAKELKLPVSNIQSLVDFLVEDKVFGIEYKFTTPYIYIYSESISHPKLLGRSINRDFMGKEEFYRNANQKKIPHEQIEGMWREYLEKNIPKIRQEFFRKAKERDINEASTKQLWDKYLSYL